MKNIRLPMRGTKGRLNNLSLYLWRKYPSHKKGNNLNMVVRVSIINSIVGRDAAKISLRNIFLLAYAITAQMNRYFKNHIQPPDKYAKKLILSLSVKRVYMILWNRMNNIEKVKVGSNNWIDLLLRKYRGDIANAFSMKYPLTTMKSGIWNE